MGDEKKEVLLKVEHLTQCFKMGRGELKAVDDVSFEVHKGEVFGLVGESGCGKTTTGRSILKIYDITGGSIYFKGQRICAGIRTYKDAIREARKELKTCTDAARIAELTKSIEENKAEINKARYDHKMCDKLYAKKLVKETEERYAKLIADARTPEEQSKLRKELVKERRIASKTRLITQIQMIFQDPIASLDPRMTVREIIAEGMLINGIRDQKYIDEKVYEVLEKVGLVREHAGRYPHEFSGGQRQRIGIARSVVMHPEMIIADEPVSALDVSVQAQVINLLNELRDEFNLTIMFIAHDLSVVKYFSDRIGVMYFGKMVEMTTSDELFAHPLHPYTKSLLSAIPLPDPQSEKKRTRIVYNALAEHDYSEDKPSLREIVPGHFVHCNNAEEAKYREELGL